ncbi:MAG: flagellar transcriptional regulator FlhD [Polaromonas sp.]|nr:flagellar transcriptional regulator FlhD [Polaromonas sp.]
MTHKTAAEEIGELNLTYLLLAQRLLREDCASAMYRFGFSREIAQAISSMPLAKIMQMAMSGMVLCRLRLEETAVFDALINDGKMAVMHQTHVAIVLGGQPVGDIGQPKKTPAKRRQVA